ncbi:MAG: ferrochelatase [Proteobacteria bacterium]|nr:ferrochelatase [Pseudomonadota bacterium]
MTQKEPKIGVLISNLGSPDAPDKKSVKRYLKQFLTDPRVIQPVVAKWIWWLILNVIILNTRPKKSAKLYRSIWDSFGKGPPLVAITQKQLLGLQKKFNNTSIVVEMAMRYGKPSIEKGVEKLLAQDIDKLIVLPLYPQYSRTTTESTFDVIHAIKGKTKDFPELQLINSYHKHPRYIKALKQSTEKHWQQYGKPQKLIISFHGIPKIYCDNGDIYPQHCEQTAKLLVEALGLKTEDYLVCYQSRFGKLEWLQPYLDITLQSLPAGGTTDVQVICPGFAADCLETLEEIEQENKLHFLQAGGKKYSYVPALNDSDAHISCLESVISKNL